MLQKFFDHIRRSKTPLGGYNNFEDVLRDWSEDPEEAKGKVLIFAVYECEHYEGSATVIFYDRKAKKYFEAYGSHCSCYDLAGFWAPEEIVMKELENRLENGYFAGRNLLRAAYLKFVETQKTKKAKK